jgi:hypothetical protein
LTLLEPPHLNSLINSRRTRHESYHSFTAAALPDTHTCSNADREPIGHHHQRVSNMRCCHHYFITAANLISSEYYK